MEVICLGKTSPAHVLRHRPTPPSPRELIQLVDPRPYHFHDAVHLPEVTYHPFFISQPGHTALSVSLPDKLETEFLLTDLQVR